MKKYLVVMLAFSFFVVIGMYQTGDCGDNAAPDTGGSIEAGAEQASDHPEIPEGFTCNDCHQIKLDGKTTATEVWLTGEYVTFGKGEGVMSQEKILEAIVQAIGGRKHNKTFVLATALNNVPLSTTAEFALDEKGMVLYGVHEVGTEKLIHIQQNPRVSLNWHQVFTSFTDTLCVQFVGTAELIEASDPEFEQILLDVVPYEELAQAQGIGLEACREMLKQSMLISKITVSEATITNAEFRKEGMRPWQRWER